MLSCKQSSLDYLGGGGGGFVFCLLFFVVVFFFLSSFGLFFFLPSTRFRTGQGSVQFRLLPSGRPAQAARAMDGS